MPTNESSQHIVTSYDQELKRLRAMIARMGGLAEQQFFDRQLQLFAGERARNGVDLLDGVGHKAR